MNETIDNTKLAGIIKTFDKPTRLAAKRFLKSPYFNSSDELVDLFQEIHNLQEKEKPLSKVNLWKKMVNSKAYSDQRFRKYCSDLSKLMERFLAQQAFEKDELQQRVFLLRQLSEQKPRAEKLTNSAVVLTEKLAEQYPFRDTSYFLYQYLLQKSYYELEDYGTRRDVEANIEEISAYLDWFFLGEKLRLITEAQSRKKLKARDYNISFANEISYITKKYFTDTENLPHIEIYYQIIQILSAEDADENYYKLKKLIADHAHLFPRDVAVAELYGAAQNYCVKKINHGNSQFLQELFEIFNLLIDQGLIVSDGNINPWYFRNIVFVGLRLGKYDWTEEFILEYQEYLPADLRENALTFNLAQLYFYQKKYEKVLEQLRSVEYDDMSYNLNSKTILIATYYELDEIDLLESHLDTFNTFLTRRKDFTSDRRNLYKSLIRYTRRLIRIAPNDKNALKKLKEEVQANKGVANAGWLLEKITALE